MFGGYVFVDKIPNNDSDVRISLKTMNAHVFVVLK